MGPLVTYKDFFPAVDGEMVSFLSAPVSKKRLLLGLSDAEPAPWSPVLPLSSLLPCPIAARWELMFNRALEEAGDETQEVTARDTVGAIGAYGLPLLPASVSPPGHQLWPFAERSILGPCCSEV